MKVFDILGRNVATLVNEEKVAGVYMVNFDAGYLANGIYFYSISSGSFNQTKKDDISQVMDYFERYYHFKR